jgi:uncharacterized membrane protein HdeD (DUF308 family)
MKDFTNIHRIDPSPDLRDPEIKIWRWLLWTGIIMMLLGLGAILLPFVATMAIEILIAIVLLAAGITQAVHALKSQRPKGFTFRLLAAGLYGLVGILLLAFPLHGALTLTLLLAVFFTIVGTFKIALALHLKPYPSWDWLMISGLIAVVLGALIWMGLPGTATWAIGLLVGIELLFSGWSMIRFALSVRNDSEILSSS